MRSRGNTRDLLWRWRSNPLRRRDDVIEAWLVLVVWAVVVVGGALAGAVTASAAAGVLAEQRAERRPVRAVLVTDATGTPVWGAAGKVRATVRWTGPDGTPRSGLTAVGTGLRAGDRVDTWQDGRGRLTPPPTTGREAAVEAATLGAAAACAFAGLALGAGATALWRLDRHRLTAWDHEWALVDPHWNHRTG
ncbi:hypothetical protein AB0F77_12115 [Streptomyces sp. NPDC026672]|uniref:Rv1733c family protein n=1 Tax=unclassified Streptomyces TaxID=2593676 RepID=UPI0033EDD5AD